MLKLYKWSLGFFVFSFLLGFGAASAAAEDLKTFYGGFCIVTLLASIVFLMVGYYDSHDSNDDEDEVGSDGEE